MLQVQSTKDTPVHVKPSERLVWSLDGIHLLSISTDRTLKLLEHSPSLCGLKLVPAVSCSAVGHACFHPLDRSRFVVVGDEKDVAIWDCSEARVVSRIHCGMVHNQDVVWSPDGRYIVISNDHDYIGVIDAVKSTFLRKTNHPRQVRCMAWSRNVDYLLLGTASAGADHREGYLEVVGVGEGELTLVACIPAHTASCTALRVDPSFRYAAIASSDSLVSVWDLNELICLLTIAQFDDEIRSITLSPSGQHLAVAPASANSVSIFSTKTGEQVHSISYKYGVKSLAWNPAYNVLAIAGAEKPEDGELRLRDKPREALVTLVQFD